jgi:hypothetical protein
MASKKKCQLRVPVINTNFNFSQSLQRGGGGRRRVEEGREEEGQ